MAMATAGAVTVTSPAVAHLTWSRVWRKTLSTSTPSARTSPRSGGASSPDQVSVYYDQLFYLQINLSEVSSKQKAQIEKCLKSYDPNSYTTGHGKIGFFHRLLSKIVMERIDRPHYQCNTTKKLRQNFVDYLKLRKNCAKDLSDHKKKEKSKAAKQAQKAENKEEQKKRKDAKKAKNDAKKAKKEEQAAKEAAKEAATDRRRFVICQILIVLT